MLEQLAPELMVKILLFMDVPARVQLSRSNTHLQTKVFHECPQAWQSISFRHVKAEYRDRLSDGDLSKLLKKVNAREVTATLDLCGCKEIRGPGLTPLRHSRILELLNLQGTMANNNLTPVLWILHTVIQFKFWALHLNYNLFMNPSDALKDFLWKLRQAKLEQAQETCCSCCQHLVVDMSRQVVPNIYGLPETHCHKCREPFCKTSTCPMGVRECQHCGESYCDTCAIVAPCLSCGRSFCRDASCGKFSMCTMCGKLCCKDCEGLFECDYEHCKTKTNKVCLDCGKLPTNVCTNDCTLCKHCQNLGKCSKCKDQFCVKCSVGSARQCKKCCATLCGKPACCEQVQTCHACDSTHCKECGKFEFCILCERSFCSYHDRLVDCFKCGMRHCRKCGYHEPCKFCARACFDECTCQDLQQAIKKARTS